jgi:hypothetical protein
MKIYEIDFNGHVACRIQVENNEIKVVAAMDGWGNPIELKNIIISDKT